MKNPTPKRYRNDHWVRPANVPLAKTIDAALSYVNKHRRFMAPKLIWEDKADDGTVIAKEEFIVRGVNSAPQGIKKFYVVEVPPCPMEDGYDYVVNPSVFRLSLPLFAYDCKHDQWYRNLRPEENTENHPLYPCVPPDKPVIGLPDPQLRYLIAHGVMRLMEAKLNGMFDNFATWEAQWSNRHGQWIEDFNSDWLKWVSGKPIK